MNPSGFTITIRATSITVQPGSVACEVLQPLLNLMDYEDEFMEVSKSLGYILDSETDTLYLHKGVDIGYLRRLLGSSSIVTEPYDEYQEMTFEYEEIIPPRDEDQEDVIDFIAGEGSHKENINKRQLFLVKAPGFGKAQPNSERIPTISGMSTMGDLMVGQYVFDRYGNPTRVLEIFPQGCIPVYEITFSDGRKVRCNDEHLWYTRNSDTGYMIKPLSEIMKDYQDKFYYVRTGLSVNYKSQDVPIDPFTFGSTIGQNKIPVAYLYTDIQSRRALLDGLMHSKNFQGNTLSNRYHSTKEQVDQVQWLLYSLRYTCARVDDETIIFGLQEIQELYITNICYAGEEESRCIRVESPDHLYLTDDFIVTHNTYCSGVGLCKFHAKTMIIMHRDSLRKQWKESLYKMSGLSDRYVHEITSSEELYAIAHGDIDYDYDVYLMTHATFRAGMARIRNMQDARNICKNLGIGMKIIDEAHLEFRDTLMMDFVFNVCRNLYLTATDGRSAKEENAIFKHVFADTLFYRKPSVNTNKPNKWVNYTIVHLNTHCLPNIYRYKVAGGRGMSPASYGKWVIAYDKKKRHFKCIRDLLRMIYEKDENAKVIVFVPLIELCEDLAYFCKMELNYDDSFPFDLNIKTINSKNTKAENERNKRADVIVTTIQSAGTGTDIPGISAIICCSPYVSGITAKQVWGRIRYCGKICDYFDIVDESVQMDKLWFRSRSKKLKSLALNVKELTWSDDEEENKTES